jgi:hypothetical protein
MPPVGPGAEHPRTRAHGLPRLDARTVGRGPPYATDDPEPVDYKHWELYLASQVAHDDGSGTAPRVEANYGVLPNVQLHLIAPLVFDLPNQATGRYGYGDAA